ncbi:MAG: hypothetical protein AAGF13_08380 [Pseudomonadota bacterium]
MEVLGLDHVHLEVRDRAQAAEWFGRVLGLVPHAPFALWAKDPLGPLILATPAGAPTLSLFEREALPPTRDATVALRVNGKGFLTFLERLKELDLKHSDGDRLTRQHVIDHEFSWSIYFVDPWDNRLEITTYDYNAVARAV